MPPGGERTRAIVFFPRPCAAVMSKKLSKREALDNISTWNTEEVLCLLRKNGLEEYCKAVAKRQIDGDEFLHLTDGKLALWKSDLTRPLIGKLLAFVQKLKNFPENYVSHKTEMPQNDDHLSDSGSWGTDFEDETTEESHSLENTSEVIKPSMIKQASLWDNRKAISKIPSKKTIKPEVEETYANFGSYQDESCQDEPCQENTYANFEEAKPPLTRNVSKLHDETTKKSLAEMLNEELRQRKKDQPNNKPTIGPKPEVLPPKKIPIAATDKKLAQKSFLHNAPKIHSRVSVEQNKTQRRMAVPPPADPKKNKNHTSLETKKGLDKELFKLPPVTIRNLDLVANLPARTEESEDEYETFDENVVEQQKEISRVDSKLSLHNSRQGSVESVYKAPSSAASYDDEQEDYEIYEAIKEVETEDNDYLTPIQRTNDTNQGPPPLPTSKPRSLLPSTFPNRTRPEKLKERSPDKKSATLPHSGSNNSPSNERATRPLPPPPDRQSYTDKPWYHTVTREQGITLIREQGTYNNSQDGYFLVRPSTTKPNNPFTLVLWYRDKVYNISVRKRNDNRYALGSPKVDEKNFSSIEEMVAFHKNEELILHSDGIQTGSTRLTDSPPK
nr:PREDICTED: lymphocyte cytosolic protein 2-like isoform X1 [Linepithema humile]